MNYKFLPALLFVVELGVVYGVGSAVSAQSTIVSADESIVAVPRREVRLVVVPREPAVSVDERDEEQELPEGSSETSGEVSKENNKEVEPMVDEPAEVAAQEEILDEKSVTSTPIATVPFYSQFADISSPDWQKVGCGIASLAMLIDYYADEVESVDNLLGRGIAADAFLSNAGWTHAGLIGLSKRYGMTGESVSLANLSMPGAFTELEQVLRSGPVMASVHYTFEPTNPIPHLVVVTGVRDGRVYYNDPAEPSGGNSISVTKFQNAWKKRYIAIRPA